MCAVQVAQAPGSEKNIATEVVEAPPEELTLEQTLRIMDVATTMRKEQAVVDQQLNIEETKAMLRERLLDAAKVTGEHLTEEQVNIAIEHYYDKLHVFDQPKWSFEYFMANVYVMRGTIIKWTVALGATAGILSYFL